MPQRVTLSPSRLVSFLAAVGQLGPGLRRLVGIEAGLLEVVGVEVEQRRRIVERHAVDRPVDHGVAVQRREELAEELVAWSCRRP